MQPLAVPDPGAQVAQARRPFDIIAAVWLLLYRHQRLAVFVEDGYGLHGVTPSWEQRALRMASVGEHQEHTLSENNPTSLFH